MRFGISAVSPILDIRNQCRSFRLVTFYFLIVGLICGGTLNDVAFASYTGKSGLENQSPQQLDQVGIKDSTGKVLSLEKYSFFDENNEKVPLKKYFSSSKPVVLTLVYYECPSLCSLLLNGFLESLKKLRWVPGKDFEVVTISINPKEGSDLARLKKETYVNALGKPGAETGWHFLYSKDNQVEALAREIGFGYKYDTVQKEYAHGAAIYVLTPQGKISRTLYGIEYSPKNLRFALVEASKGKVGSVIDRFLLYCYRYDPNSRGYSLQAFRVVQAGGVGTILVLGAYFFVFWRRQRDPRKGSKKRSKSKNKNHKGEQQR